MTNRLYYSDGYLSEFNATVVSCNKGDSAYEIILDQTAFFPEGGGQPSDEGFLDGMPLLDLIDRGSEIIHLVRNPIEVGKTVIGKIDFDLRFRRMQNHSGEHLISGTVNTLFGFSNVGFHIGEDSMTLDFSGELSASDILQIELEANRAVWKNIPVVSYFPSDADLKSLNYRSKKEIDSDVRIISINNVDVCACCAPHVKNTGEIGLVKIIDFMRHRGGTRVLALCGYDAYVDTKNRFESTVLVSNLLSAPQGKIAEATKKLLSDFDAAKAQITELKFKAADAHVSKLSYTDGNIFLFVEGLEDRMLREIANRARLLCSGVCAVFCGADGSYKYIISSQSVDLIPLKEIINTNILGRGGGTSEMLRGSCTADRHSIEDFFTNTDFTAFMDTGDNT